MNLHPSKCEAHGHSDPDETHERLDGLVATVRAGGERGLLLKKG